MGKSGSDVIIRFFGDSKSLEQASRRANAAISDTGVNLDKLAKTAAFSTLAAGAVAFGKESVRAAIDDRASQEQLKLALQNTIGARDAQVKSAEDYIARLQEEVGVLDDQLRPAYATLVRGTRDQAEAQKLLALATDISAGKNLDLSAVADALAKAYQGNTKGLRNLGIELKGADGSARSFTDISKELTQIYAGSAKKAFDADPAKKLNVQLENLKETVGNALLPVVTELSGGLSNVLGWFNHLDPTLQKVIVLIGLVGGGVFAAIKAFAAMKAALVELGVTAESTMATMGIIGLAVAGVATALALFSDNTDTAAAATTAFKQAADGATSSIKAQDVAFMSAADAASKYAKGVIEATDKPLFDALKADPDNLRMLNELGLSLDDVAKATHSAADAQALYNRLDTLYHDAQKNYDKQKDIPALYNLRHAVLDASAAYQNITDSSIQAALANDEQAAIYLKTTGILQTLTPEQQKQIETFLRQKGLAEQNTAAQQDLANQTNKTTAAVKAQSATFVDAQSKYFDVVDALGQMKAALGDGSQSFLEQQRNVLNAKKTLAEYATLLDLPSAQVTEIMSLIDKGSYDAALKALNRLTAPKTIELIPMLSQKGGIQSGRLEDNMDNLGQQAGFTFIDSLNKAAKAAAKSSGAGGSAGQTVAEKAAAAFKAKMDTQDAMFELGEIDESKYRKFLEQRIKHFAKYSADYMAAVRAMKQLDDAVAKKKADDAKAQEDARAKAKADEDAELARAAQRAIVAADIAGATYLTVNTDADPNAIVRALRDYVRMNGKIVGVTA